MQREYEGQLKEKAKEGTLKKVVNGSQPATAAQTKKRRRWDQTAEDTPSKAKKSSWDAAESATPSNTLWDETPGRAKGAETPGATPGTQRQWEATPGHATPGAATPDETHPVHRQRRVLEKTDGTKRLKQREVIQTCDLCQICIVPMGVLYCIAVTNNGNHKLLYIMGLCLASSK